MLSIVPNRHGIYPEAVSNEPLGTPVNQRMAAEAFRTSMFPYADFHHLPGPAPLWYGWALFEAFNAGANWARSQPEQEVPSKADRALYYDYVYHGADLMDLVQKYKLPHVVDASKIIRALSGNRQKLARNQGMAYLVGYSSIDDTAVQISPLGLTPALYLVIHNGEVVGKPRSMPVAQRAADVLNDRTYRDFQNIWVSDDQARSASADNSHVDRDEN